MSAAAASSVATALKSVPTNALAMLLVPVIAASLTTVPVVGGGNDSKVGATIGLQLPPLLVLVNATSLTTVLTLNGTAAADADAGGGGGNASKVGANRPPTSKGAGGKPTSLVAGAAACMAATACSMFWIASVSGREKSTPCMVPAQELPPTKEEEDVEEEGE